MKRRKVAPSDNEDPGDWELTPAQIREIKRRLADADDPIRYLLVSQMGPRFSLYYNVSDDTYVMNDPSAATLFKRRKVAESVKETLGRRIRVVRCRTRRRHGARVPVLASLPKSVR
ncbi:MAG: hypothetical protein ACYTBS_08455 [Planctomycetota bacterium]|jgi:hypothetical protein